MICVILVACATLSTALAEPPSSRYLSSSGNHVDITEAKARGFGSYSDSSYDTTGYGSGSGYSSPSSSESFSPHSLGSQSSSSTGYVGSSPVTYGSHSSFNSQGSGFTPSYSPSLSYGAGSSSSFGSSYGSSSGSYGGPKGRLSKAPSQSYGAPTYSPAGVSSAYNTPLSHNEIEEQTDPSDPVKYEFAYEVNAPESGTEFGHRESRAGGVTTGQYHVLLPDGRLQTVDYLADKAGYRPTVTYHQTDRVATQVPALTQSRSYGKTPTTASPSGYGSLSLTQSSHGSPIVRQTSHSSSGYGPIQRSQPFAASDFHGKPSERASSPIIQALTDNDQV